MEDRPGAGKSAGEWSELKDSKGYGSYDSWALVDPLPDPTEAAVPEQTLSAFLRVFARLLPSDGPGCADATYKETVRRLRGNPAVRYDRTEALRLRELLAQERDGERIVLGEDDTAVLMLKRPDIQTLESDGLIRVLHVGPAVALAERDNGTAAAMRTSDSESDAADALEATDETDASAPKVLVGVVEDAVPFLNGRFRRADGGTRFEKIWLQSRRHVDPAPLQGAEAVADDSLEDGLTADETAALAERRHDQELGILLGRRQVDRLLKGSGTRQLDEAAVYAGVNNRLLRTGERRSTAFTISHGAQVIDLACGDAPGEMDDARILAVQLPPHSVLDTSGRQLDPYIIQAVRWLLRQGAAANRRHGQKIPLVINLSFGVLAGPKDGTGFVERWLKREVARYRRRTGGAPIRIVLAYGNSYRMRQVAFAKLEKDGELTLDWRIPPDDRTDSFLELRTDSGAAVEVALTPPGGSPGFIALPEAIPAKMSPRRGKHREWRIGGKPVAAMLRPAPEEAGPEERDAKDGMPIPANDTGHSAEPEPLVPEKIMALLAVRPTEPFDGGPAAPVGPWKVTIRNEGPNTAEVALQIQRDDTPDGYRDSGRQSYFDHPDVGAWDPELFDYSHPGDSPITREGTHSSYASVIEESASVYAVGAARRVVGIDDPSYRHTMHKPSLYTSSGTRHGMLSQSHGPTLSAFGDDGFFLRGVRATGSISGSSGRLSGTSSSAPQITRALVSLALWDGDGLPDLVAPADREEEIDRLRSMSVNFPQDQETRARLGTALIDPALR